jgi:hypothetical protein
MAKGLVFASRSPSIQVSSSYGNEFKSVFHQNDMSPRALGLRLSDH